MHNKTFTALTGIAAVTLTIGALLFGQHHPGDDARESDTLTGETQVIEWTPSTRNALIKEMQAITVNYQILVAGLAQGNWTEVVKQSHTIYSSFILKQELSEKDRQDLHRILPARFIELDSQFHIHAKKLALAAKQHDRELATFYAGQMLNGCVNCHRLYAQEHFPGLAEPEEEATHGH